MKTSKNLQVFIYNKVSGTTHSCLTSKDDPIEFFLTQVLQTVGLPEHQRAKLVLQGRNLPSQGPSLSQAGVFPLCTVNLVCEPMLGGSRRRMQINDSFGEPIDDAYQRAITPPASERRSLWSGFDRFGLTEDWANEAKFDEAQLLLEEAARTKSVYDQSRVLTLKSLEAQLKGCDSADILVSFYQTHLAKADWFKGLDTTVKNMVMMIFWSVIQECKREEP